MALLHYYKASTNPGGNVDLISDQAGSFDLTHGGGNGSGWWRDDPDSMLWGYDSAWRVTPSTTGRTDFSELSSWSLSFATKDYFNGGLKTAFRFFNNASPFIGWGLRQASGNWEIWDQSGSWKALGSVVDNGDYNSFVLNWTYGGDVSLYHDGTLVGTATGTNQFGGLLPGHVYKPWGENFSYNDNIQIHDRHLTAQEIAEHAANPREWVESIGLGDEIIWINPDSEGDPTDNSVTNFGDNGQSLAFDSSQSGKNVTDDGRTAYELSGSISDSIETSTSTSLPSDSDFTMAGWFKLGSSPSSTVHLMSTSAFGFNGFRVYMGSASMVASFGYGGTRVTASGSHGMSSGTWYHVALVSDKTNGTGSLYIDGTLVGGVSLSSLSGSCTDTTFRVGASNFNTSSERFDGRVDDIRVYDRAITSEELSHLALARGVAGTPSVGLGDEDAWYCPSLIDSPLDISGNGNTGTYQGGMTTVADVDPTYGGTRAYQFDGVDDRLRVSQLIQSGDTEFSLSWWSNLDAVVNSQAMLQQGDNPRTIRIANRKYDANEKMAFAAYGGNSGDVIDNVNFNIIGTWQHWTMTATSGGDCKVYLDGVEILSFSSGSTVYNGDFLIGSAPFANFFNGKLDDIRLYRRILTDTEIAHLATARGVEGGPDYPTGLGDEVAWYCPSLDDSPDDVSGNVNHGTYQGGMATVVDDGYAAYEVKQGRSITANQALQINTANSVSFWVKVVQWETANGKQCGVYGDSTFLDFELLDTTYPTPRKTMRVFVKRTGTNSAYTFASDALASIEGGWAHIYCEIESGFDTDATKTPKLWVNGEYVSTTSTSGAGTAPSTGTGTATIGDNNFADSTTVRLLDDIRVFNRLLTDTEIAHLSSARGVEGPPPVGLGDERLWYCPSLNDSPLDISGNGNTGTYQGGMGTVADTGSGGTRAYDFDGVDDYIVISGLAGQYTTGGSHSTSVWVYQDAVQDQQYFNRYQSSGGDQRAEYFFADITDSRTRAGFKQNTLSNVVAANNTNQSGVWYHLTSTYDHTTNRQSIYKNAVRVATQVFSGDSTFATNYAEIGRVSISNGATQVYGDLRMDDFRSFTRVLTDDEIEHLATARGVEGAPSPPVGLGDEISWHCIKFDFAADQSGNGHDAATGASLIPYAKTDAVGSSADAWYAAAGGSAYALNLGAAFAAARTASVSSGQFTCSYWLLPESTHNRRTFGSAQSADTRIRSGRNSVGNIYTQFLLSGSNVLAFAEPTENDTVMNHFVLTYESGTAMRIYHNGVQVAELLSPTTWSIGDTAGAFNYPDVTFGGGWVDDIRTYDRALTQAEITHLSSARGVEGPPPVGLGDERLWYCPSLNDSPSDISGNANHGTYQGGMTTVADADPTYGGSRAYEALVKGTDFISGTLSSPLAPYPVTITGWVTVKDSSSGRYVLLRQSTGTFSEISFTQDTGVGAIRMSGSVVKQYAGTANATDAFGNYPLDTWKHVAVTVTATDVELFIDGVSVATNTYAFALDNLTSFSLLDSAVGRADDIRVFDRILTQAEITHLSSARGVEGAPGTPPPSGGNWHNPFRNSFFYNPLFDNEAI